MAYTPVSGLTATLSVGGTPVILPGTGWTLSDDANFKDVSNFRDGRAKMPTLHDSKFSGTLIWDSGLEPNLSANGNLVTGQSVACTFKVGSGAGNVFAGQFLIVSVEVTNPGLMDVVTYKVNGELTNATLVVGSYPGSPALAYPT